MTGAATAEAGLYADGAAAIAALVVTLGAVAMAVQAGRIECYPAPAVEPLFDMYKAIIVSCFGVAIIGMAMLLLGWVGSEQAAAASAGACVRWLGVAALAYLMLGRRRNNKEDITSTLILIITALLIGPASTAAWLGWLPSANGFILMTEDTRISAVGARLSGLLQYPNAQGAWAAVLLLWALARLTESYPARKCNSDARSDRGDRRNRNVSCVQLLVVSLLTVPLLHALLLSESRGAWLVYAAGIAIGALLLRGRRLALWLSSAGWTCACAALAYTFAGIQPAAQAAAALPAGVRIAALLLCCAAGAAGLAALHRRLLRRAECRARTHAAALALLALGAAAITSLLPPTLLTRGGHYETAISRVSMYSEAIRLWRQSPLLGHGGDAWQRLAGEQLGVHEVHSGYLDVLLDFGLVGLVFIIAIAICMIIIVMRNEGRKIVAAPIAALLLHAAIDFDMSYGSWWLLLLALGAYGSNYSYTRTREPSKPHPI
ncbi:hypothetical protein PCURB6_33190 [Paenibacillus curdlanolyticus]|nr:hypothetical protein PCURB6_33190 [Paenibacillus curdlanolyticus]